MKCLGENIPQYFIIDLEGSDIHEEYTTDRLQIPSGAKLILGFQTLANFRGKRGQVLKEEVVKEVAKEVVKVKEVVKK